MMSDTSRLNLLGSILKVVEPYEGTAFLAAQSLAVSCCHVCVSDSAGTDVSHPVVLKYLPGSEEQRTLRGRYLPEQSDPAHDLAVVGLEIPADLTIPAARMSPDDEVGHPVIAMGYPCEQSELEEVEGVIFSHHPVKRIWFEADSTALEVLRIDTRAVGFYRDGDVRSGMSGGPVWNEITGTVVGVVEGKKPRGLQPHSPPDGYAISLKHLRHCSAELGPYVRPSLVHGEMVEDLVGVAKEPGMRSPVVDWVIRRMSTPDSRHRYWCYIVLGRIGGEAAEIAVARGLFDEDELARMGAGEAWKLLGH